MNIILHKNQTIPLLGLLLLITITPVYAVNTLTLTNEDNTPLVNYPVMFGRAFIQGEIPPGFYPQISLDGTLLQTQADIKNKWPDGSLKYAIISFILPQLNVAQSKVITFQTITDAAYQNTVGLSPIPPNTILSTFPEFDARMQLTSTTPSAGSHTISARQMLQNNAIHTTWLSGPIVTAYVLADHTSGTYDKGWKQKNTRLERCTSSDPNQAIACSPANTLEVTDASSFSVNEILNLNDELILLQAKSTTTSPNTLTVQRNYGGLIAPLLTPKSTYVTSNTWEPLNLPADDKYRSFRPGYVIYVWPTANKIKITYMGEIPNTEKLQDLTYDLTLTLGNTNPTTVLTQTGITQHIASKWIRNFWYGGTPPTLEIDHNQDYLTQTGLIDTFDSAIQVPELEISSYYNQWIARDKSIMKKGLYTSGGMGAGGNRPELSRIPKWDALWINSMDWRLAEISQSQAELAASWPVYFREGDASKFYDRDPITGQIGTVPALGKFVSFMSRPTAGYYDLNDKSISVPMDRIEPVSRFTEGEVSLTIPTVVNDYWRISHEKGHIYNPNQVSYLLTGEYDDYEQLIAWGMYTALIDFIPRGPGAAALLDETAPRYQAKPFHVRLAASIFAVDGTPEDQLLDLMVYDAIVGWMGEQNIPLTQEPAIPNTAFNNALWQFARNKFSSTLPHPLHFWMSGNAASASSPVNPSAANRAESPWMIAMMADALGQADDLGYPVDKLLEYIAGYYSWHFNTAGINPIIVGSYRQGTGNAGVHFTTPQQVFNAYTASYQANPCFQTGDLCDPHPYFTDSDFSLALAAAARIYQYDPLPYTWLKQQAGTMFSQNSVLCSGTGSSILYIITVCENYNRDPRYALAPSSTTISCTPNQQFPCTSGFLGVCATGQRQCNAQGTGYGTCTPTIPPNTQPETCDGQDNDCDGTTDEGCACSSFNAGNQICTTGQLCSGGSFIPQAAEPTCCTGTCQTPITIPQIGLIASYSFDEGTGTSIQDSSGNNNHGTITNNPQWVSGVSGTALDFDGIDDYVTIPNSAILNPTNEITITAWVKNPISGMIISKGNQGDQYHLRIINGLRFNINGGTGLTIPTLMTPNIWHHVAATYDATTMRLYVDGIPIGSPSPTSAMITTGTLPLLIGIRADTFGGLLNGYNEMIDEVHIYDIGLSAAEIISDMNSVTTNVPPQFATINPFTTNEGTVFQTTIIATDPNNDPLTFTAQNLPPGAQFNTQTHTLSWPITFTQAGIYQPTITVSDGVNTPVTQSLTINVKDCALTNALFGWSLNGLSPISTNTNIDEEKATQVLFTLSTTSTESCEGVLFHVTLLEDDGPLGTVEQTSPLIDLGSFTVTNDAGTLTWTTTYQEDVNNYWGDSAPEYVAKVEAIGEPTITQNSPYYLKVILGDADNDGVVNDCDSNTDNTIGACGCASWDDVNNELDPNPNPGPQTVCPPALCNQAGCAQGSYPTYQSIPTQCIIGPDNNGLFTGTYQSQPPTTLPQGFTYDPVISCLVSTTCTNEQTCTVDDDLDQVMNRDDLCPGTITGQSVNIFGQPLPLSTEYTDAETTNFMTSNLQVANLILKNDFGRISYESPIDLVNFNINQPLAPCQLTDINAAVNIVAGSVTVDPQLQPNLNYPATITLINQNFVSPVIYFQGPNGPQLCTSCTVTNYQNGKVTFTISGW